MDAMQKLEIIKQMRVIYNICFRNAGVGFQFYRGDFSDMGNDGEWRKHLHIDKYYPSLAEAIEAEYNRLTI